MSVPLPDVPCAVYRCYAADGRLLYVGKSADPEGRWSHHKWTEKQWVKDTVRREVEWFDSDEAAVDAEQEAIWAEEPSANREYVIPPSLRGYTGFGAAEPRPLPGPVRDLLAFDDDPTDVRVTMGFVNIPGVWWASYSDADC